MLEEQDEIINLPDISTKILTKVLEFCQYQIGKPDIVVDLSKSLKDSVLEWYNLYIDVDAIEILYELLNAANYLNIQSL
jgi:S-phase kinase-associated protein 1